MEGSSQPENAPPFPEQIGRYRIVRRIADGGMGSVFEAEQDHPRRRVALKVIRADLASHEIRRRFAHEAQILARLQHPGIAQIYDAGWADTPGGSQPYFAMEYVSGLPLTTYANQRSLDVRERLRVFVRICQAVQHAHQKGVIHRDLKPGNILVDDSGQPKVLDFGVARATDSDLQQVTVRTDVGQLLGTLPYMSPEQVAADPAQLDTRSDVYALGVILHELLTGRLPYDLSRKMLHEAVRIIREVEPTTIGSESRIFRGDLETIVAKALEKDKERRYASAAELATDVERHLNDEPIVARPPSVFYQARKFTRRNKVLVAGLVSVFAALVTGTVVSLHQAWIASEARALAETRLGQAQAEARKFQSMNEILRGIFGSAQPMTQGREDVRLHELLDRTLADLDRGMLGDQREVEAPVRATLAEMYDRLGRRVQGEAQARRAIELFKPVTADNELEVARVLVQLTLTLIHQVKLADAAETLEQAFEILERRPDRPEQDYARWLATRGLLLHDQGQRRAALEFLRDAVRSYEASLGADSEAALATATSLAFQLSELHDYPEAEEMLRRIVEARRSAGFERHPKMAYPKLQLGRVLLATGRLAEAEQNLREALEIFESVAEDEVVAVADVSVELAALHLRGRDVDRAEPLARRGLELRRRRLGEHRDTATALTVVADVEIQRDRLDAAEALLEEARAMRARVYGERHVAVGESLSRLGSLMTRQRRNAEAEARLRDALSILREGLEPGNTDLGRALLPLGRLVRQRGAAEEALPLLREAFELYHAKFGPLRYETMESRDEYMLALLDLERWPQAEALLLATLPVLDDKLKPDHPLRFYARVQYGYVLSGLGRHAEGRREALAGWERLQENRSLFRETRVLCLRWIASILRAQGDEQAALEWTARADAEQAGR